MPELTHCGAFTELGDKYYGTPYGFWCDKPKGHEGEHRQEGILHDFDKTGKEVLTDYVFTWKIRRP